MCLTSPEWTNYLTQLTDWINQWNAYVANGLDACKDVNVAITDVNDFLDKVDSWAVLNFNDLDESFDYQYSTQIAAYDSNLQLLSQQYDADYSTIVGQVQSVTSQIDQCIAKIP